MFVCFYNVLTSIICYFSVALALVLLGANGHTFEEVATLLGVAHGVNVHSESGAVHEHLANMITRLDGGSGAQVRAASAVFVQTDFPVRDQYRRTAASVYGSDVVNLDFRGAGTLAQQFINSWVSGKTAGRIDSIMSQPPSPDTELVVVSTLHLKAEWEKPFTAEITSKRPFYAEGRDVPATSEPLFMANGGEFPYFRDETYDCEVVGLPYRGGQLVFYVVLPRFSTRTRLRDLQNRLNSQELQRLAASTRPRPIILLLPKMRLTDQLQLNDALKYLGLTSLFNPIEADLSLISPGRDKCTPGNTTASCVIGATARRRREQRLQFRPEDTLDYIRGALKRATEAGNAPPPPGLYADQVLHKVWLDVNEAGTEAAAATSISLTRDGSRKNVVVDSPFFFFIRHESTKLMLFWGSVNNPPSSTS